MFGIKSGGRLAGATAAFRRSGQRPPDRTGSGLGSALCVERSEEWVTGRRYLNMGELAEQRRDEQEAAERVMPLER